MVGNNTLQNLVNNQTLTKSQASQQTNQTNKDQETRLTEELETTTIQIRILNWNRKVAQNIWLIIMRQWHKIINLIIHKLTSKKCSRLNRKVQRT